MSLQFWRSSHGKVHVGAVQRRMLCDSRWSVDLIPLGSVVSARSWHCDICWRRGGVTRRGGGWRVKQHSFFHQTRFGGHEADLEHQGDCWATAVACIAGLDEAARDELNQRIIDRDEHWLDVTNEFLSERGVRRPLVFAYADDADPPKDGRLVIASGPSPRIDGDHATVYRDGALVWDPHPDGTGILEVKDWAWLLEEVS